MKRAILKPAYQIPGTDVVVPDRMVIAQPFCGNAPLDPDLSQMSEAQRDLYLYLKQDFEDTLNWLKKEQDTFSLEMKGRLDQILSKIEIEQ